MASNLVALADSLGWALVHSIWQVAIVSALVFVALKITPRENPQLRFALAYLGMAGSAAAFLVTFFVYYGAASGAGTAATPTGWAAYLDMLGKMTWLISLLWSLGFAALGTRYVQALRQTHLLRRVGVSQVPEKWEERFRLWLERLGGDPQSTILYSDRISTPVTIGAFKPVILVPIGFFMRLPADQAEAVLVHEIAHICRQDYLLGLIQAMITNIFFFHPGIYYLSRQVDTEREYACDDRAARETGNAGPLAEALSRIAMQRDSEQLGFAMAADGPHTPIMDRINRLGRRPVNERGTSMPMAALSMAFAASLMIAIGADASIAKESEEGSLADAARDDESKGWAAFEADTASPDEPGKHHRELWNARGEERQSGLTGDEGDRDAEAACCDRDTPLEVPEHPAAMTVAFSPSSMTARFGSRTSKASSMARSFSMARSVSARGATAREPVARVFNAVQWQVDGEVTPSLAVHDEADCEDAGEAARERAESRAEAMRERAERDAERAVERAERRAERNAARIERQMERVAARIERDAERRAERYERRIEREAEKAGREAEREFEERHEQQIRFEQRNGRLTISMTAPRPPAPPAAPDPVAAPAVQTMSLSIGPAISFR